MQTFLPYSDFKESAKVLDNKRLGKQRVEVLQILRTFLPDNNKKGWLNHPARLMWKDNIFSLYTYGLGICNEWKRRGYKDTCAEKMYQTIIQIFPNQTVESINLMPPVWIGKEDFHKAHRSNLLRKDSTWYGKFGWVESNDLPYVWPI